LLGTALREHRFSCKWHYAVDMEETNQVSLKGELSCDEKGAQPSKGTLNDHE
jgi:hypothetical protein